MHVFHVHADMAVRDAWERQPYFDATQLFFPLLRACFAGSSVFAAGYDFDYPEPAATTLLGACLLEASAGAVPAASTPPDYCTDSCSAVLRQQLLAAISALEQRAGSAAEYARLLFARWLINWHHAACIDVELDIPIDLAVAGKQSPKPKPKPRKTGDDSISLCLRLTCKGLNNHLANILMALCITRAGNADSTDLAGMAVAELWKRRKRFHSSGSFGTFKTLLNGDPAFSDTGNLGSAGTLVMKGAVLLEAARRAAALFCPQAC